MWNARRRGTIDRTLPPRAAPLQTRTALWQRELAAHPTAVLDACGRVGDCRSDADLWIEGRSPGKCLARIAPIDRDSLRPIQRRVRTDPRQHGETVAGTRRNVERWSRLGRVAIGEEVATRERRLARKPTAKVKNGRGKA